VLTLPHSITRRITSPYYEKKDLRIREMCSPLHVLNKFKVLQELRIKNNTE
jgi:hypothetical protein